MARRCPIIVLALWFGGFAALLVIFLGKRTAIAQASPVPGTEIINQATGSFNAADDPRGTSPTTVDSNIVKVTVVEVSGITVTASGLADDGSVNPNDVITFDFTITNVGNDPTQFFIPGVPSSVVNGTAGTLEIVAYDPDGAGTEASSQSVSIDVPGSGVSTGDASALDLPDGAIPPGGTVTVRVPVTVASGAMTGSVVSVTLGNTPADAQNQPYNNDGLDVLTQDNLDTDAVDNPLTAATEIEAASVPFDGEREASASQDSSAIASDPGLLLVKRITAVNNNSVANPNDSTPLNSVLNDGVAASADDHPHWPSGYLTGALNGGSARPVSNEPADSVEYSIYFLSIGDVAANNVRVCDRIPLNTIFLPDAYANAPPADPLGSQPNALGIAISFNGSDYSLTGAADGDGGYYFPPGIEPSTQFPSIHCDGINDNGAVVVMLGDLPPATGTGSPPNAYGSLRFQVQIN